MEQGKGFLFVVTCEKESKQVGILYPFTDWIYTQIL